MFDVLLPVIVGGVIGIAGGLIGPPFLHHLQQKAEKKRKRAEKFEELVTLQQGVLVAHLVPPSRPTPNLGLLL